MKVSTITYKDIADYIKITEISDEEKTLLNNLITIAKKFITSYTGIKEESMDEYDDFIIVIFILCQDMYDNRSMYIDKANINKVVETILGMHTIGNIC